MPSDVLITPASSKVEFTDGNNATKTLRITGTSFSFNSDLGIGITSPTSKLNVLSTTSLSSVFKAEGVNGTLFEVTDDLSNSLMSVNTIGGLPVFEVFANNTIVAGQYNANDFVISGNKVGVGTASPVELLDIAASANNAAIAGPKINFKKGSSNKAVIGIGGNYLGQATNTDDFIIRNDGANILFGFSGAEKVRFQTDGNVGIGATNPNAKLDIEGTGGIFLDLNSTNNGSREIRFQNNGVTQGYVWCGSTFVALGGGNITDSLFTMVATGNVGIGNNSPNNKLAVSGSVSVGSNYNVAAPANGLIVEGSVGIGASTLNAGAKLHVVGNADIGDSTDDTGIIVRHGAGSAQYGRIRFYSTSTNIHTIHSFPTAWQNGTFLSSSTGALNLNGTNGITFGSWNNVDVAFASNGTNYFKKSVGIGITSPSAILHTNSTTSGATLIRADGTNGTLFSVVDDLSDSLMSVNNSAGLPVLEVFADDRVVAGQYGQNDLVVINNKVGLGTNNPVNKLSVLGSVSIGSGYNTAAPTNGLIVQGDVGIGVTSFAFSSANRANLEMYGSGESLLALRNSTGNSYIQKSGADFYINNVTNGFIAISNNGSERWRITNAGVLQSNNAQTIQTSTGNLTLATAAGNGHIVLSPHGTGNVGIGTATPSQKLEVQGNVKLNSVFGEGSTTGVTAFTHTTDSTQPSVYLWGKDHVTYPGQVHIIGRSDNVSADAGKIGFYDYNGTGWDLNMVINKNGNVGIGAIDPAAKLQINNAGDSRLIIYETGASPYTATLELSSQILGTYGGVIQYDGSPETLTIQNYGRTATNSTQGSILFKTKINNTTATNVVIINGFTGNVGIATLSPSEKLEVVGVIKGTSFSGAGSGLTGIATSLTAGTVTTNANLTGPVTSIGNATTITDSAVTYAKIQNVSATRVLGRITASAGVVQELTGSDIATIIGVNAVTNAVTAGTANALNTANSYEAVSLNLTGTLQFGGNINWNHGVTTELGRKTISYNIWQGGKKLYADEDFNSGNNSISVYNNAGGSALTITRTALATAPNSSGQVLRVAYTPGSNGTSPGFGGFTFSTQTAANKVFVTRFVANIPTGRSLGFHSNAYGTNPNSYWLTNNVGTGKWEEYVFVVMCGNTGTFSGTNYFAISGGADTAFSWDIASATVFDVTNKRDLVSSNFESYQSSNTLTFNYLATNLNVNNPVPIYAFDVTSGAETRSIKAGLGYERHLTNGRGTLHIYNRSTDDTTNITGLRASAGDIKVSIDNAGNVGLGITIPSSKLHVFNSAGSSTIASNAIAVFEQNSNAGIQVCVPDASEAGLFFSRSGAAYYSAITRNGTDLLLKNNSATAVTINSNGNVGVGITDPTAKLDITGSNVNGYSLLLRSGDNHNGTDSVQIAFGFANQTNYRHSIRTRHNPAAPIGGVVGNNIDFYVWKRGTDAAADLGSQFVMTMQGDGNVGIGVTSPNYPIDLQSTTSPLTLNLKLNKSSITNDYAEIAFQLWSAAGSGENTFGGAGTSRPSVVLRALNENGTSAAGAFIVGTFEGGSTNATLTEKFRITSTGSVGIGVNSPATKLHVYSPVAGAGSERTTPIDVLTLESENTTAQEFTGFGQAIVFRGSTYNNNTQRTLGKILHQINDDSVSTTRGTSLDFQLLTDATGSTLASRMYIKYDGNVGIGTISPAAKLHVYARGNGAGILIESDPTDNANQAPALKLYPKSTDASERNWSISPFRDTPQSLSISSGNTKGSDPYSNATTRLIIDGISGSVGIGTTSPSSKLHISNAAAATRITITDDIANGRSGYIESNYSDALVIGTTSGVRSIRFAPDNSIAMTIAVSTNNVGIGTTNPSQKLDIVGSYGVAGDDTGILKIRGGLTSATQLNFGVSADGGYGWIQGTDVGATNNININLNPLGGNVGIGNIAANNKLAVSGSASIGSNYNVAAPTNGLIVEGGVAIATTSAFTTGGTAQLSVSTNTNAVALSIGASNTDMSYIRRLSTAVFQWQTYNGTNAGQIQLQPYGGNVGIGLTAPTAKLNVLSSTSLSSVFKAEGINGTLFEVTDDLSNSLMSVNTIGGLPVFEVFANNTIIAGQYNANDLVITGNKIGIGTATPSYKLDVNGESSFNGVIRVGTVAVLNEINSPNDIYANIRVIRNRSSTLNDGMYINYDSTGTTAADIRFYANGQTERMRIRAADGNVGIGTSIPVGKFDVRPDSSWIQAEAFIVDTDGGNNPRIRLYRPDGGSATTAYPIHIRNDSGNLNILTGAAAALGSETVTSKFYFTAAGNLGIGTTAPSYLLSVNTANDVWHAQFGQVGGNQLRIGGNTTNGGVIGAYSDNTNNNPRQLLLNRDGGNVAVGASSANNKLHVNGSTSIGSSYNTAGPTDGLIVQGSVGIGVTSPDANAKLHVYGNDAHKYIFYTDTAGSSSTIFQRNNTAESVVLTLANTRGPSVSTDRGTSLNLDLGYGGSSASAGTLARGAKISAFSSTTYSSTASTQNAYLAFYTALAGSLTEKMRIDSNGNVGIGTVSPSTTLHLNSTTSGATLLRADGTNGTLFSVVDDLSDSLMSVNNSAGLPVLEVFADDRVVAGQYGANDFVLVNNKLGLGIINPVFKLDVNGTGAFRDTVYIGPNIGTITWGNFGGGTGFGMRSEVGRALSLGANGSFDYIVINTSGSVGIGATNPATLLQIGTGTPTSVTGGIQFGGDTGARIYRINSSTIQVSNNLIVGGTLTESSSIRYKENIKTVSAPILSKLEGIRPVTYNKKDNVNNTEYGIIAEELNEIFPEFVNKNDNGEIESVNYSRLTVLLIKAVKELKQEIDILKNK